MKSSAANSEMPASDELAKFRDDMISGFADLRCDIKASFAEAKKSIIKWTIFTSVLSQLLIALLEKIDM